MYHIPTKRFYVQVLQEQIFHIFFQIEVKIRKIRLKPLGFVRPKKDLQSYETELIKSKDW